MTDANFETSCDRLSGIVDEGQFERLRWARNEGPMLARLVELAHGAIADRPDFALVEEGASRDEKRFVLKVHGNRIVALAFALDGMRAVASASEIDRGRYAVTPGPELSTEFAAVDEAWMAATMATLFARITPLETAAAA